MRCWTASSHPEAFFFWTTTLPRSRPDLMTRESSAEFCPRAPGQPQIAGCDGLFLPNQFERPNLFSDGDHIGHGFDAFWISATLQKRPGHRIIAGIGISAIGPHGGTVWDQDLGGFKALTEIGQGSDPRRQQFEPLTGHFADNAFADELLPPAFGLAVIHHQIGIA